MRTIYILKVRPTDQDKWSEPERFETRKERDECEKLNRVIGGMRTHSYEEKEKPKASNVNC